MNNKSLYLLGGAALLSTTALSTTAASAATILNPVDAGVLPATTLTAPAVATQVFSATTTAANGVTIRGTTTAAGGIMIDLSPTLAIFDLKLEISSTTAAFSTAAGTTPTLNFYQQTTAGTLELVGSVTGCTLQPSAERLTFLACNPAGAGNATSRIDAVVVTGIGYTGASALRTTGTNVTLSGATYFQNSSTTIDSITPAVTLTSKSAVGDLTIAAGATVTIDNNAATPFTLLVSTGATTSVQAFLGSINFSGSGALGTNLADVYTSAGSTISNAEVRITYSSLSDPALVAISYSGDTRNVSQAVNNTVTFTVLGTSLNGANSSIIAVFNNGSSAIAETTGTLLATVTPTPGDQLVGSLGSFTGALAKLSRGGLSVSLNSLIPGSMSGQYISFLRIVNQSSVAGAATIVLRKESDGTAFGTYTSAVVQPGGTVQVNSVDIDNQLAAANRPTVSYNAVVTGSFNGYVQSLIYTVDGGIFSDASGFRNGALTQDP